MFRTILVAMTAALAATSVPASAQDDRAVWDSIENIHGDAGGFFDFFGTLQDAAANGDLATIADYAIYPLLVNANNESYDVLSAEDLIENFDTLVYPETLDTLVNQDVGDLIVTSEGVGIGDGAIWLTNVCLDDTCAQTQWSILSINN